MGAFGIDIPLTRENGKKMIGYSEAFKDNVKKLYSTISELVNSNYTSPEAIALANEIGKYEASMYKMADTIFQYGNYLLGLAGAAVKTQQEGIDNANIG